MPELTGCSPGPLWEKDPLTGQWHMCSLDFLVQRAEVEARLVQQRKDAEIALAAALISLEGDLPPQQDVPPSAYAPNGMLHAIVASGKTHTTSAAAIADWKRALLEYVATHSGDLLWWRARPEIFVSIPFAQTTPRWIVYSRLAIGNAETIPASEAA